MSTQRWLLLTDYASKYRISVSTLRRRIKAGSQPHRFEAGRYYLPDDPIVVSHEESAPDTNRDHKIKSETPPVASTATRAVAAVKVESEEPLITTTSKLLNELKQAYTLILQEREEQILHLKEEISDLKTLVRVLESENSRLSRREEHYDPYSEGPSGSA